MKCLPLMNTSSMRRAVSLITNIRCLLTTAGTETWTACHYQWWASQKSFCGILYSCGKIINGITWHRLCQKLDDDHASRMRSRQLTSDTNYTTHTSPQTHHQLIHILTKSHLRGSTRIAKQPRFLKIQKSLFTKMPRETSFANARPFWSSSGD